MSIHEFTSEHDRRGYTLAELMLLVALAAILVAIFIHIRWQLNVYSRWVVSISVSADGKRVVAAMADGSARIWDLSSGSVVGALPPSGLLWNSMVAHSPDGNLVAGIRWGTTAQIEVCDLNTRKIMAHRQLGQEGGVAFSADGKRLAVELDFTDLNSLRIVDLSDPDAPDAKPSPTSAAKISRTMLMSFSPDEKAVYLIKSNGDFVTWDVASGQVTSVSMVPAGKSENFFSAAALSSTHDQAAIVRLEYPAPNVVSGNDLPTNAEWFVDVFNLNSSKSRTQRVNRKDLAAPSAKADFVESVAYIHGGNALAILCNDHVEIWDAQTLTLQMSVPFEQAFKHMAASADGRILALAEQQAIYLLEGDKLRKIVDLQLAASSLVFLFVAFVAVFAIWFTIWRRNSRSQPRRGS
jgi:WD40 repeat protein